MKNNIDRMLESLTTLCNALRMAGLSDWEIMQAIAKQHGEPFDVDLRYRSSSGYLGTLDQLIDMMTKD